MQEEGKEDNAMARIHTITNIFCIVLPLIVAFSCLISAAMITVDRGHSANSRDVGYSDFSKSDVSPEKERLSCGADLDEYDGNSMPSQYDDAESHVDKVEDAKQEVDGPEVDDEYDDKKKELKAKKWEEAEARGTAADVSDGLGVRKEHDEERESKDAEYPVRQHEEDKSANNEADSGVEEEKQLFTEMLQEKVQDAIEVFVDRDKDALQERPTKNYLHDIRDPSSKHQRAHHKVKLKEFEQPGEDIEELEKEIETIAERDPKYREKMHRKRYDPHKKSEHASPNEQDFDRHVLDVDKEARRSESRPASTCKERRRVAGRRHEDNDEMELLKRDTEVDVDDWSYCGDLGPDKWEEKWPDCGGNNQSPINLDTSTAKIEYEPLLKWKGYSTMPAKMTLINNGHSVVLKCSYEDCGNRPFIWDSLMNHEYVFGELTFHWGADEYSGSEHTLNFIKYPLEMQAVHYRREFGSIEKAQEVPGGLAIVGILFHLETSNRQNQGVADIQNGFSKVRDGPSSSTLTPFPLSRVIPQFAKHYLAYNGSLTTPPCSETVIWIVHQKPASISKKQLRKFHRLKNEGIEIKKNVRPIQKDNKRCILEIT